MRENVVVSEKNFFVDLSFSLKKSFLKRFKNTSTLSRQPIIWTALWSQECTFHDDESPMEIVRNAAHRHCKTSHYHRFYKMFGTLSLEISIVLAISSTFNRLSPSLEHRFYYWFLENYLNRVSRTSSGTCAHIVIPKNLKPLMNHFNGRC